MIDSNIMRGPLGWSVSAICVIILFCIFTISTLITPLANWGEDLPANTQTISLIEKHNEYASIDIARFNGRSAFFKAIPIRKPPPPYTPPPPRDPEPEPEAPRTPPPPATYMGPPLIAIIGDEAWFRGSGSGFDAVIRLQTGQEKNGLMLVGTQEPTLAIVQHRGGDYTLPLFTAEEPFFLDSPPPVSNDDFFKEVD